MNNTVSQPPWVKLDRAAGSGKNNTEAGMANKLTRGADILPGRGGRKPNRRRPSPRSVMKTR